MKIQITNEDLTCVDLTEMLGVKVNQIATGVEGVTITIEGDEITNEQQELLAELYKGTTLTLDTGKTKAVKVDMLKKTMDERKELSNYFFTNIEIIASRSIQQKLTRTKIIAA